MMTSTEIWRICKGILAAAFSAFFGLHVMIQLLVYAIGFDLATGLIAGWVNREISSEVGYRGMARKLLILLGVAAAEIAGRHIGMELAMPWGGTWGIGAAVAAYYTIQEAVSITENMSRAGVPLPRFVLDRLEQLKKLDEGGT